MADSGSVEPREALITTAINFLLNSKVQQSTLAQRKAFLEKKGLTKEEIDIAVARSGSRENVPVNQPGSSQLQPYPGAPPQGQPMVPVPYYPQPAPPSSTWARFRDLVTFAVLVGGVGYSLYKFYQNFLKKYLFGKEETLSKMDQKMLDLQESLVQTLTKVQESLTAIQGSLKLQEEKLQTLSMESGSQKSRESLSRVKDSQFVNELKTEVSSIKGLLLNRRQFPPTPNTTPVLPSWQMPVTPVNSAAKSGITSPDDMSVSEVSVEGSVQQLAESEEMKSSENGLDQSSQSVKKHLDLTGLNQNTEDAEADLSSLNQNLQETANHNPDVLVQENLKDEIIIHEKINNGEEVDLKLSNSNPIKSSPDEEISNEIAEMNAQPAKSSLGNGVLVEDDSMLEVEN